MIIYGFEHFHPIKGVHPDTFPEYGKDIIARARKIINKKTENDLFLIINFINWLVEQSPAKENSEKKLELMIPDNESYELNDEDLHILERDFDTGTYALKAFQEKISLPPLEGVDNLTWSEIFAVLALGLIDKVIDDEKYYLGWKHIEHQDWLHEWRILSHSSYWLIEAMDAVATAEGYRSREDLINSTKEKISLRNTNANFIRHAKTNEAILAFDKFHDAIKHKSIRNSAKLFSQAYSEKLKHLSPDNHIRTLCDGLTKYRKGLRRTLLNP